MKQLVKLSFKKFYEINEFVVRTTPMRVHYYSKYYLEKWVWQRKKAIIKNLLDSVSYRSIIDVGCGDGGLYEVVKKNCEYVGVDISPTQLKFFRGWIKENRVLNRPKLVKADVAKKIPFEDKRFDAAIACDALEHFLDPVKAMKEIKRVVKKNGYIIFCIPNERLFQLCRFITGKFPIRSPDHIYSIMPSDIEKYFPKTVKKLGIPFNLNPSFNLLNIILTQNDS